ncbi:uncharacterized protein LOC143563336 [Bidens hawaiensis]|uniref:uncharacterized protein LOC143563336 n=1 Tax=Bidens hawaiensis TaxID=980011 RepID=UPI00404B14A9
MVAINYFTKWVEAKPVASITAASANGQVERANRSIKDGIKSILGTKWTGWVDELPYVLWAFKTQKKASNSETPLSLTYGTEDKIPVEIGVPSAGMLSDINNEEKLRLNFNLLEERRELALIREHNYERLLQKYYDSKVKICKFHVGDFVFRNNEASGQEALGKLAPTSEGPYRIKEVLYKGAYKLENLDGTEIPRKWNIGQLKKCYI